MLWVTSGLFVCSLNGTAEHLNLCLLLLLFPVYVHLLASLTVPVELFM